MSCLPTVISTGIPTLDQSLNIPAPERGGSLGAGLVLGTSCLIEAKPRANPAALRLPVLFLDMLKRILGSKARLLTTSPARNTDRLVEEPDERVHPDNFKTPLVRGMTFYKGDAKVILIETHGHAEAILGERVEDRVVIVADPNNARFRVQHMVDVILQIDNRPMGTGATVEVVKNRWGYTGPETMTHYFMQGDWLVPKPAGSR